MEVVEREEGKKYADDIHAEFGYVSALDGNGIKEFFQAIAGKILEKIPKKLTKEEENKIKIKSSNKEIKRKNCCGQE